MADELRQLDRRKRKLQAALATRGAPAPRLHPNLAEITRRKVADLHRSLDRPEVRTEAAEALRALIDEIRFIPASGALGIQLVGDLATILNLANRRPGRKPAGAQVTLVAGAGFEPATFRL